MLNYLLWPILVIFKAYFDFIPSYYGQRIQIYFCFFLIIIGIIKLKGRIPKSIININLLYFLIFLFISQLVSMISSSYRITIPKYNYSIRGEYIRLLVFVISIYIHYIAAKFSFNSYSSITKFLKGGLFALLFALAVSYIQLLYVIMPNVFEMPVKLIATTIEARWIPELPGEEVHRFYVNGSYVETTQRVNGLTEEASTNAMFFSIAFIPFLIASIKNNYNIFTQSSNTKAIYILLALIIIILILGKTSLGIGFTLLTLLILLKDIAYFKKIILIVILLLVFMIFYAYTNINFMDVILDNLSKVNNLSLESTANRLGNIVALILTVKDNFLFGVGRGFLSYYIVTNMPEWATHNPEYQIYLSMVRVPVLSYFFGFIAEYGVIVFLFCSIFIGKMILEYKKIMRAENLNTDKQKFVRTLANTVKYYIMFFFFGLLFNYDGFQSMYIIIIFFFVCSLSIMKKEAETIQINIKKD